MIIGKRGVIYTETLIRPAPFERAVATQAFRSDDMATMIEKANTPVEEFLAINYQLPSPLVATVANPLVLEMNSLPADSGIRVINAAQEVIESTDPNDPVEITEPGTYTLWIDCPLPYEESIFEIEVL